MRTTALLFHDIVSPKAYESSGFQGADADIYKLDPAEFRRHMETIAISSGLQPEAVNRDTFYTPGRHLTLTFDDGGISAIDQAAPILDEYGWPAHFFVTCSRIGTRGFLDPTQIRTLHRCGHVIGSHSMTHPPRMAALTSVQIEQEWSGSVKRLEDILGEAVTTASIPCGDYSRAVAVAAVASGIQVLFTSEPVTRTATIEGCMIIGRFSVQQGVSEDWVGAVVADRPLPRLGRFLSWNGKKMLKTAGGSAWLEARKSILAWRGRSKSTHDGSRSPR